MIFSPTEPSKSLEPPPPRKKEAEHTMDHRLRMGLTKPFHGPHMWIGPFFGMMRWGYCWEKKGKTPKWLPQNLCIERPTPPLHNRKKLSKRNLFKRNMDFLENDEMSRKLIPYGFPQNQSKYVTLLRGGVWGCHQLSFWDMSMWREHDNCTTCTSRTIPFDLASIRGRRGKGSKEWARSL